MDTRFNYLNCLYRKNNHGQPCMWYAEEAGINSYKIHHGIVGKQISTSFHNTHRLAKDEIKSKINAKRKEGYKFLNEIKDNVDLPVEGELLQYLNSYLPDYRTTIDGSVLPMLAKAFDNTNNKLFKNVSMYYGQYKINGLRCFISAYQTNGIFSETRLQFQSREGTYWTSLKTLEHYLLNVIPDYFLNKMIDEHYILDGELYLPGYSVNEINHFVKDPSCPQNAQLQYWCYDLAVADTNANERKDILLNQLGQHKLVFDNSVQHLNNKNKFIILPSYAIASEELAIKYRNLFIDNGFEGLILRNPNEEYQFGKRNSSMIKFKKSTDGKFIIVDIKPEGVKRPDIPLFVCKNDINDAEFECHLSISLDEQRKILKNREKYIGKFVFLQYTERSGIKQVPFHISKCLII